MNKRRTMKEQYENKLDDKEQHAKSMPTKNMMTTKMHNTSDENALFH